MTATPTVLLVGLIPGHSGMHLPRHLARHGLRVAFIGSSGALASRSGHVHSRWDWKWDAKPFSYDPLVSAIRQLVPAHVVPLDEAAGMRLEQVGRGFVDLSGKLFPADAVELVRRSLGDPASYFSGSARRKFHAAASKAGVEVPTQDTVSGLDEIIPFAHRAGWPVVLKRELSMGGVGVFVLDDEAAATQVCAAQGVGTGRGSAWVVQEHIQGSLGMHAILAKEGQVLAEVGAMQLERRSVRTTSPSSVVRLCRHDGMREAARRYACATGLSGLHAWDFLLTADSRVVMIEHNARPIAISTLGALAGSDLCAALAAQLGVISRDIAPASSSNLNVTLFPDEWWRDPNSRWLQGGWHDVPWDDHSLLAAVLQSRMGFA
jgi:predicted ATP-grasp superfamily ATP-dependent carboligase